MKFAFSTLKISTWVMLGTLMVVAMAGFGFIIIGILSILGHLGGAFRSNEGLFEADHEIDDLVVKS